MILFENCECENLQHKNKDSLLHVPQCGPFHQYLQLLKTKVKFDETMI